MVIENDRWASPIHRGPDCFHTAKMHRDGSGPTTAKENDRWDVDTYNHIEESLGHAHLGSEYF
jgi:hypothetical protein